MKNHASYEPTGRFMQNRVLVAVFLMALNFIVHHFHLTSLGLTDEDYTYILPGLGKGPSFVLESLTATLAEFMRGSLGWQGRALGVLSTRALSAVGWMAGGVPGLQFVSLLISTACSYVMYRIFAQRGEFFYGFLAALFLTLYPAYTLRQYLNAQFWLMPSLLFMLLAIKSLMAGRKILPYAFIACSLVTYESTVLPFLAAPLLLEGKWDRRLVKRLIVHLTIMAALIALAFWLRASGRETRAIGFMTYWADVPARMAASVFYGTLVSAGYSLYHAAVTLVTERRTPALIVALASAPVFSYIIHAASRAAFQSNGERARLKRAVAGVVFIALAHVVGFFPGMTAADDVSGATLRWTDSRIHLAASFGTAIFLSSLCLAFIRGARNDAIRLATASSTAIILAALAGYAYGVQSDFRPRWLFQQCVWTKIIAEAPDIGDGTVILIDARKLAESKNLPEGMRWYELMTALPAVYELPTGWKEKPKIVFMPHDWDEKTAVRQNSDRLEFDILPAYAKPAWVGVTQGELILFKAHRRELARVDGAATFSGREVRLKPRPATQAALQPLEKGFLFDSVFDPGCTFAGIAGAKPPRDIEGAPRLSRTLRLDGAKEVRAHLPGGGKAERFTIELWLRAAENSFGGEGFLSEIYPPMPAIIGPLRLDHWAEESMFVTMTGKEKNIVHEVRDVFGSGKDARWVHVELGVDNIKREATLFINGRLEKKFQGTDIPLKGPFVLGNGYLSRFWRGEIADVRISSVVRHTADFEPEKTAITRDEHTLYFTNDAVQ